MRLEELENNMYIKSTDTVEKFLLNIIQEYFKDSNDALEGSKEYIIKEAVDRLRTEMDYNALGVLSITLPNGDVRHGDVTITLDDLGGEPLISPKLSAFNVNFGTEANTACEGNDPRLYDARMPIRHEHEIQDIMGLEGMLSTIFSLIERTEAYKHQHDNKEVLDIITYTGKNTEVDLGILDTLEPKIDQITEEMRNSITQYIQETQDQIDDINETLRQLMRRIDDVYQYVLDKCTEYLNLAMQYTDTKVAEAETELKTWIDANFVRKSDIQYLIEIAKDCYTFVNTDRWCLKNLYYQTVNGNREVTLPLSQYTLDEFDYRSVDINANRMIIFDFYLQYEENGVTYRRAIPYMDSYNSSFAPYVFPVRKVSNIAGYIQNIRTTNNSLKLVFQTNENQIPANILANGWIVCDIYTKPYCPVYI